MPMVAISLDPGATIGMGGQSITGRSGSGLQLLAEPGDGGLQTLLQAHPPGFRKDVTPLIRTPRGLWT